MTPRGGTQDYSSLGTQFSQLLYAPPSGEDCADQDPTVIHFYFGYYHMLWNRSMSQHNSPRCLFELRNMKGSCQLTVEPEVKE